jgi:hypothetical protein
VQQPLLVNSAGDVRGSPGAPIPVCAVQRAFRVARNLKNASTNSEHLRQTRAKLRTSGCLYVQSQIHVRRKVEIDLKFKAAMPK